MTSLLKFRRRLHPPDLASVEAVFSEVAELSFFAYTVSCDSERFAELVSDVPGDTALWLRATVTFDGAFSGSTVIHLPATLGEDLASAFVGMTPGSEVTESECFDALGEFANMVCGSWLTRECGRRKFDLQPPSVARVVDLPSRPASGDAASLLLTVNDMPVTIDLLPTGERLDA